MAAISPTQASLLNEPFADIRRRTLEIYMGMFIFKFSTFELSTVTPASSFILLAT
jgi:hypothetical protein